MGSEGRKFAGESNWKKKNAGDKNTGDISSDGDGIAAFCGLTFTSMCARVCVHAHVLVCICTVCVCAGLDDT